MTKKSVYTLIGGAILAATVTSVATGGLDLTEPDTIVPVPACSLDLPPRSAVTKVTDGDTLHAMVCDHDVTVRIIGLNTPETVKPRTPPQCYGKEASEHAKTVLGGKTVLLTPDPKAGRTDKYGRRLYRVEVDGADYAEAAIRAGFGEHNDYGHKQSHSAVYAAAMAEAKSEHRGAWSCPSPFKE